ncbi:hypothetical protein GCM10027422_34990 [Hymenobacter arcticus]
MAPGWKIQGWKVLRQFDYYVIQDLDQLAGGSLGVGHAGSWGSEYGSRWRNHGQEEWLGRKSGCKIGKKV